MQIINNPQYAVIDCAIEHPAYQCFNRLVSRTKLPFTYHAPPKFGIDSLADTENFKAIIIFGSHSNVQDKLPWQIDLSNFIKEKILDGVPVLGICFGHQLVAETFGAAIGPTQKENGRHGLFEFEVLESKWDLCKRDKHHVLAAHSYEVKSLPENFYHIARSNNCEYEMICHKHLPYLGIQSHPEATLDFVKHTIEDVSMEDFDIHQKHGDKIVSSFLRIAERF